MASRGPELTRTPAAQHSSEMQAHSTSAGARHSRLLAGSFCSMYMASQSTGLSGLRASAPERCDGHGGCPARGSARWQGDVRKQRARPGECMAQAPPPTASLATRRAPGLRQRHQRLDQNGDDRCVQERFDRQRLRREDAVHGGGGVLGLGALRVVATAPRARTRGRMGHRRRTAWRCAPCSAARTSCGSSQPAPSSGGSRYSGGAPAAAAGAASNPSVGGTRRAGARRVPARVSPEHKQGCGVGCAGVTAPAAIARSNDMLFFLHCRADDL